jgi:hypothetical protein
MFFNNTKFIDLNSAGEETDTFYGFRCGDDYGSTYSNFYEKSNLPTNKEELIVFLREESKNNPTLGNLIESMSRNNTPIFFNGEIIKFTGEEIEQVLYDDYDEKLSQGM